MIIEITLLILFGVGLFMSGYMLGGMYEIKRIRDARAQKQKELEHFFAMFVGGGQRIEESDHIH